MAEAKKLSTLLFFFSSLNEDWKNPDPHSFRKLDMTFG